jgi:hypothetical protein
MMVSIAMGAFTGVPAAAMVVTVSMEVVLRVVPAANAGIVCITLVVLTFVCCISQSDFDGSVHDAVTIEV